MNLTPHLQEKDIDGLRTEQVQKKKNEFHLVGEERRIKGHTLFCFNLVTREINQALYDKLNSYTKEQLIRIIMGDNAYSNVKHYGN